MLEAITEFFQYLLEASWVTIFIRIPFGIIIFIIVLVLCLGVIFLVGALIILIGHIIYWTLRRKPQSVDIVGMLMSVWEAYRLTALAVIVGGIVVDIAVFYTALGTKAVVYLVNFDFTLHNTAALITIILFVGAVIHSISRFFD